METALVILLVVLRMLTIILATALTCRFIHNLCAVFVQIPHDTMLRGLGLSWALVYLFFFVCH